MNFINKYSVLLVALSITVFISACGNGHSEDDGHDHGSHSEDDGHDHEGHSEEGGHEEHEEGVISLSNAQIKTIGLEMGTFSEMKINDYVKASGTLGLPPSAFSSVSARAAGFIKGCKKFVVGGSISKGSTIAYLENPEFIKQQQEYLEVKAELSFLRQDLERQESLVKANAGVIKDFQKLQADVAMKEARLKGIGKYLSYLGIDVVKLTPDNLKQQISIIAPSSGYLAAVNLYNGMYIEPNMELLQVIDDRNLILELDVFEKDVLHVKKGLKVSYNIPALGAEQFDGKINTMGKEFNIKNKTVRIYGQLEGTRPRFIKDLFISAKIWLNDQIVQALPETSIINDGGAFFIYAAKVEPNASDLDFQKIMVIPGTTEDGNTSIKLIDKIPEGMKVVTKGAYYVYAQSKAGALTHEH